MEPFKYNVLPGRYRHFKGNEYEVLGMARHSETEGEWWCTAPCTVSAASGCARPPCGARLWSGTAGCSRALCASKNKRRAAAENAYKKRSFRVHPEGPFTFCCALHGAAFFIYL